MIRMCCGILVLMACAAWTHADDIRPVKEPVAEVRGALVIGGTGTLPDVVRDRFLELAGGKNAKLVVLPSPGAPTNSVETWQQRGVAAVTALAIKKREDADDAATIKPLAEATGVWIDDATPAALMAKVSGIQVTAPTAPSTGPNVVSMAISDDGTGVAGWYGAIRAKSGHCYAVATINGDPKEVEAVLPGNCTGDAARAALMPLPGTPTSPSMVPTTPAQGASAATG